MGALSSRKLSAVEVTTTMRAVSLTRWGGLLYALVSVCGWAGNLEPPGAPASTPGPESRFPISTLPFTINQPGSHYLTRDLVGTAGINVAASNVTIDLNGFSLTADTGAGASGAGIRSDIRQSLRIRNGSIRDWPGNGIHIPDASDVTVEDLQVTGCGAMGIEAGNAAVVRDCVADGNGLWGIAVGAGAVISGCTVRGNGPQSGVGGGILAGASAQITGCTAQFNRGTGLQVGDGSAVTASAANSTVAVTQFTDGGGIVAGAGCTLTGCTANANAYIGIQVGAECSLSNCAAAGNWRGIDAQEGCSIAGCAASGSNDVGFLTLAGCLVTGCTARGNAVGITGDGSYILNCVFTGNHDSGNGGGILTTGSGSRVEGNLCQLNDVGIKRALVAADIFVRNMCQDNTVDFALGPNAAGTVIDATAGGAITSTNPWANFSF
jgi:hypothetical protein